MSKNNDFCDNRFQEWYSVAMNAKTSGRRIFLDLQGINQTLCDKINYSGKEPQHQHQQQVCNDWDKNKKNRIKQIWVQSVDLNIMTRNLQFHTIIIELFYFRGKHFQMVDWQSIPNK